MPTVLLITPYFPPMSVVGAKRPLNLVRHLPVSAGSRWYSPAIPRGRTLISGSPT